MNIHFWNSVTGGRGVADIKCRHHYNLGGGKIYTGLNSVLSLLHSP